MSDIAISLKQVGKMYKLFARPKDKVWDALGLSNLKPWRKKNYQEFWALRDINLMVPRGTRIGIIGRNGAGKSTLLKIITGNITPTEGKVEVNGSVQALLELGTGFHPDFTGRKNIHAYLAYYGLPSGQIAMKEEEIIDFAELEEFIDQPVKSYSAGMFARLAFSTATAIEPEILIIDEVLGAGDAYFTGKCVERMRKLTEDTGATVLFVSHDLASVQRLCDQAIWINRGQLVAEGQTLDICKLYLKETREREERRLRATNMRLMKGTPPVSAIDTDLATMILHFIVDGWSTPKEAHPINRVAIIQEGEVLAELNIGEAADNDPNSYNRTIVQPGFIEWGEPLTVKGRYCREFKANGGRYLHAAIQLAADETLLRTSDNLEIQVDYFDRGNELYHLEIFNGQKYERIGTIGSDNQCGWRTAKWKLDYTNVFSRDQEGVSETPAVSGVEGSIDILGGEAAAIQKITCLAGDSKPRNVFQVNEPISIEMDFMICEPLESLWPSILILSADGIRVFSDISDLGCDEYLPGNYQYTWRFDPSPFGPRDYVISVALYPGFDFLDDTKMQPAYSLWDRRIHFKIEQPLDMAGEMGCIIYTPQKKFAKVMG